MLLLITESSPGLTATAVSSGGTASLPVWLLVDPITTYAFSVREHLDSGCDWAFLWGGELRRARPDLGDFPGLEELGLLRFWQLKLFHRASLSFPSLQRIKKDVDKGTLHTDMFLLKAEGSGKEEGKLLLQLGGLCWK